MNIKLTEKIDRELWLRYLQVDAGKVSPAAADGSDESNKVLFHQMDEAEKLLLQAADIRWIYRVIDIGQLPAEGISIRKHLEGCHAAAIMAVTIGSGIDELIRRYEITSMAMAMVLDTGASVLAEMAADAAEREMKTQLAEKMPACFCTDRFSPGYGDYPIRFQREILRAADAGRKIGITLTAGDMMVPHKSITSVTGIADHPVKGRLATCDECLLREKCELRRQGKHC